MIPPGVPTVISPGTPSEILAWGAPLEFFGDSSRDSSRGSLEKFLLQISRLYLWIQFWHYYLIPSDTFRESSGKVCGNSWGNLCKIFYRNSSQVTFISNRFKKVESVLVLWHIFWWFNSTDWRYVRLFNPIGWK